MSRSRFKITLALAFVTLGAAAPAAAGPLALAATDRAATPFDQVMRPAPYEATEEEAGPVDVPAHLRRQVVAYAGREAAGTIVIDTANTYLYYVLGGGKAVRYPVGVGRAGKQWSGTTFINGKMLRPAWVPPAVVRRDKPNLPSVVPAGAPNNPVGAAVLFLAGGERAIHGTNNPGSIGGAVSYGCIRMHNADVLDLYGRVGFGTKVIVMR